MTGSGDPVGFLTDAERAELAQGEDNGLDESEILDRVQDRLSAALEDCMLLYPMLRERDIKSIFCPDDDTDLSFVRAGTQSALGLLVLGMLANEDMIESRLSEAVRHAALASGEGISVDVELRRGPAPTIEQCLARLDDEGVSTEDLDLYEHFLWNSDADAHRVAAVGQRLGLDTTAESVRKERDAVDDFVRCPQTAITNVEIQ